MQLYDAFLGPNPRVDNAEFFLAEEGNQRFRSTKRPDMMARKNAQKSGPTTKKIIQTESKSGDKCRPLSNSTTQVVSPRERLRFLGISRRETSEPTGASHFQTTGRGTPLPVVLSTSNFLVRVELCRSTEPISTKRLSALLGGSAMFNDRMAPRFCSRRRPSF